MKPRQLIFHIGDGHRVSIARMRSAAKVRLNPSYSSISSSSPSPSTVDEFVNAAQLYKAIADKSKAHWTGEAGHLSVTGRPGPRDG